MAPIPSEANDELETLERKHAENPEGRYFVPLANVYRRHGEVQRAMALLREGLAKHPDYLSAHIVLGRCLADQGEAGAAEAEFAYVLSLDPQNLIALRTLGELSIAQGKPTEARKWYRELLVVDPMNEDARRALDSMQLGEATAQVDGLEADLAMTEEIGAAPMPSGVEETSVASGATTGDATDYDTLFGTMIDFDSIEGEGGPSGYDKDGDAVVTETIAELYTRQGFYDRAADVYRELIRRRGGDAALEERLRRVEGMAAAGEEGSVVAAGERLEELHEAPEEPEPEAGAERTAEPVESETSFDAGLERVEIDVDDLFADSFAGGFPSDQSVEAEAAAAPNAVSVTEAAEEEAESIRSYLAGVFSWSPASEPELPTLEEAGRDDSPEEAPEVTGFESIAGLESGYYYGGDAKTQTTAAAEGEPSGGDEADWFSPTSLDADAGEATETQEATPDEPGAESTDDTEEIPAMAPALSDEDLFPWEVPSSGEVSEEDAEPPHSVDSEAEDADALTTLFEEEPEGAPELPPESGAEREPESKQSGDTEQPEPAAASPAAEPAAESAAGSEEDDDLESFQAWLRSLKR